MRSKPLIHKTARTARRWLRERKETLLWKIQGSPVVAPPHIKRAVLLRHLKANGLRVFVETGTLYGDTVAYLRPWCAEVHSIELSRDLFERAKARFSNDKAIHIWHGDSSEVLPEILHSLTEPALFWLDGHYSGEGTARGKEDTPILRELIHITKHPLKTSHYIVIDDARLFDGTNGYPQYEELCGVVATLGFGKVRTEGDMIILTNRSS